MKYIVLSAALLMSDFAARAADLPATHQTLDDSARTAAMRVWKISLVPLVASQALDAASSYNMRELNPLLASANGGFEMKGTVIKMGVTGAVVGAEYLIVRRFPRATRILSKINWTTGIVTTGFAVHNYAIK